MTTRCLSRLLHTSAYRCEASSRPSSSSSGGAGFRYVLDSHGRYVRQARNLSPRQRARAAYEQQEAERTIESQGLPSTVKEALEQRPTTETAGPAPPATPSTSSTSSNAGAHAGTSTSNGTGKAALSEKEQAQLRQQYQKRKYVRGQDDSTLRVEYAGMFEGVGIPVRPIAPPADTCCMSGCPRCTYDVYTSDLSLYHEALEQSRTELRSKGIDKSTWPDALRPPTARAAADATDPDADDPTRRAYQEVDEEIKDLDIYLRTFLQFERRLRKKRDVEQARRIALQHVSQMQEMPASLSTS